MNQIIGTWISDPDSEITQHLYGDVEMTFNEKGELIYNIREDYIEKKIFMTYKIKNDTLITNQVASPNEELTKFQLLKNKLILYYEGAIGTFIKV